MKKSIQKSHGSRIVAPIIFSLLVISTLTSGIIRGDDVAPNSVIGLVLWSVNSTPAVGISVEVTCNGIVVTAETKATPPPLVGRFNTGNVQGWNTGHSYMITIPGYKLESGTASGILTGDVTDVGTLSISLEEVDTEPPETTVTAPGLPGEPSPIPSGHELTWMDTAVTLSFHRIDPNSTGVAYTDYSQISEAGPWTRVNATAALGPDAENVSAITTGSFNVTVSTEGITPIWYYSVDKNETPNEESKKNLTVRLDTIDPVVSMDIEPECETVWINGTFSDALSGTNVSSFVLRVDGAVLSPTVVGGTYTCTVLLEQGMHNASAHIEDNASNPVECVGAYFIGHGINVSVDYYPEGNGVKIFNGGEVLAGTNLTRGVNYTIKSRIMNEGTCDEPAVNATIEIFNESGTSVYSSGVISRSISVTEGYNDVWRTWDTAGLFPGIYTIWVNATVSKDYDRANDNRSREVTLVDALEVTYNLTIATTEGGNVTVPGEGVYLCTSGQIVALKAEAATGYRFVNWTGDVTGVANVNAAETNITMEGDYTVVANFAARDFTPPMLTINSPANGSYYTTTLVSLNVSADEVIDAWLYSLNGGANVTFGSGGTTAATAITSIEGPNQIIVYASDTSGNMGHSSSVSFVVDTLVPVVNITGPSEVFLINRSLITVVGTVSEDATVQAYLNGMCVDANVPLDFGNLTFATSIALAEGQNTILITATDAANNTGIGTVNGTRDSIAPTYCWVSRPTAGTTGEAVEVKVRAVDNLGVTRATIAIDGAEEAMVEEGENYSYTIAIPSGSVEAIVYACSFGDGAGNVNTTEDTAITVSDNDEPLIMEVELDEYEVAPGEQITVMVHATDNVAVVQVTADENPLSLVTGTHQQGQWIGTITAPLDLGRFKVHVEARDAANNTAIHETMEYTTMRPAVLDTGPGAYPSIAGVHKGIITPNHTITVKKLAVHPCAGTAGHAEFAAFYNLTTEEELASATWTGQQGGDYRDLTFPELFWLHEGQAYRYEIHTGSYPQLILERSYTTADGSNITCTSFTDLNGDVYDDRILAFKLFH